MYLINFFIRSSRKSQIKEIYSIFLFLFFYKDFFYKDSRHAHFYILFVCIGI